MALMNFGNEQKIGIQAIDNEHKAIFDNVNYLFDIKDHEKNEILESYDSLLMKLKEHFNTEEMFMKEHNSVNYISHKLEHDRAYKKYLNYYVSFKSENQEFDSEILISMRNWLESHLIKKDMQLTSLIKN